MWPFLLMYGSHDMRHIGFLQVDGGQRDPRVLECHTSTRRGLLKRGDFFEDPNKEILGNQGFRVREASYPSYYAPRGRDSSYFGLFILFVD